MSVLAFILNMPGVKFLETLVILSLLVDKSPPESL